jgi:hypothetical protein
MKQDISKSITKGDRKFLDTLKEYKELIAILVFFLGGVLWMFGYFATKQQLTELRCWMRANVEFVQARMDGANLSDLSVKNIEDLTALNEKPTLTADERTKKHRLEIAKDEIARKLAATESTSVAAMKKLTSGQCSDMAD